MDASASDVARDVAHRPWPLPPSPWLGFQSWRDLLFAHWRVPVAALRAVVPPELEIDAFDGSGWLGVVPFRMAGVRARFVPPLPGLSAFPELNVRTYVRHRGQGGIHFLSLDADHRLAVATGRALFELPYHRAAMRCERRGDAVDYRSERERGAARLSCSYGPTGAGVVPRIGTLEHFLAERYALFTARGGRVKRVDVHHAPWRLRPARAEIETNTMARAAGIELPPDPPLLHFSDRQDALVWLPRRD